jgi:hypothetical protein
MNHTNGCDVSQLTDLCAKNLVFEFND